MSRTSKCSNIKDQVHLNFNEECHLQMQIILGRPFLVKNINANSNMSSSACSKPLNTALQITEDQVAKCIVVLHFHSPSRQTHTNAPELPYLQMHSIVRIRDHLCRTITGADPYLSMLRSIKDKGLPKDTIRHLKGIIHQLITNFKDRLLDSLLGLLALVIVATSHLCMVSPEDLRQILAMDNMSSRKILMRHRMHRTKHIHTNLVRNRRNM